MRKISLIFACLGFISTAAIAQDGNKEKRKQAPVKQQVPLQPASAQQIEPAQPAERVQPAEKKTLERADRNQDPAPTVNIIKMEPVKVPVKRNPVKRERAPETKRPVTPLKEKSK